ncbi:MAG: hypothetical protein AAGE01_08145 [Pseudomonadota bacterium]
MQSSAAATHEFEALLERRERIIALHTPDPDGAIVEFRLICRRSGRSIYYWSESQGMVSLKASDISVPGCRRLAEALRYVVQSMHYGVYIFTDFERQMTTGAIDTLRDIAQGPDPRTIILIGERVELAPRLAEFVYHRVRSEAEAGELRPRLRDGRWVV